MSKNDIDDSYKKANFELVKELHYYKRYRQAMDLIDTIRNNTSDFEDLCDCGQDIDEEHLPDCVVKLLKHDIDCLKEDRATW